MVMRLRSIADAVRAAAIRSLPEPPRIEPPPAEDGPPVAVDQIASDKLLVSREAAAARARAHLFANFLLTTTQAEGVPLDESLPHIEFWHALVDAFGYAYLRWPHLFPEPPEAEDETLGTYIPVTEQEAYAHGLAVAKCRPKRLRIAATLSGCQGFMSDGGKCPHLRRKGERFCPQHRAAMIRHMRGLPA